VFSIYALRGDRAARVMTTILAVAAGLVSLPIGVFGVLQATMLFVAAGALWTSEARRWYRGEPAREVPAAAPTAQPSDGTTTEPTPTSARAELTPRPTSVMTAGLLTVLGSLGAAGFAA